MIHYKVTEVDGTVSHGTQATDVPMTPTVFNVFELLDRWDEVTLTHRGDASVWIWTKEYTP